MPPRLGLCAVILFAATTSYAGPYAEIRAGVSQVADSTGTARSDAGTWTADLVYERKKTIGAEGGMRMIAGTPLGLGLALDGFRSRLDQATLTGAAAGDSETASPAVELSAEDVADLGYDFDDRVTILSANAYYGLGDDEGLALDLGLGYGIAAVGDADLRGGVLFNLGARFPLDPLGYISLRVSRFQADGHTDDSSGLEFENFAATSVTLAFGMEF